MRIPDGFIARRVGRRTVLLRRELEGPLARLGFIAGSPNRDPEGTVEGRGAHPVYTLPELGLQVVWKRCRRGGLVEPILGDLHLGEERFIRELEIIGEASAADIGVAENLAVAFEPAGGGFQRVEILTRLVAGATDLEAALLDRDLARPGATPFRRALIRRTASELRRFHGVGLLHGDLNVKNILWRSGSGASEPVEITFVDLDPGSPAVPRRGRSPRGNLLRLYRSYLKGERRERWHLSRTDLYRFVDVYFRGDDAALRAFLRAAERLRARRSRGSTWRRGQATLPRQGS